MELEELAKRVEALEGPDRAVDAEIYWAVKGFPAAAYSRAMSLRPKGAGQLSEMEWLKKSSLLPAYTASLDAAMSLLPSMEGPCGQETHADFIIECTNGGLTIAAMVGHDNRDKCSWGNTPSLALCAAALRAKQEG